VLGARTELRERLEDALAQPLVLPGPPRVVFDDDDRL
jgi:hypothetical protein